MVPWGRQDDVFVGCSRNISDVARSAIQLCYFLHMGMSGQPDRNDTGQIRLCVASPHLKISPLIIIGCCQDVTDRSKSSFL